MLSRLWTRRRRSPCTSLPSSRRSCVNRRETLPPLAHLWTLPRKEGVFAHENTQMYTIRSLVQMSYRIKFD